MSLLKDNKILSGDMASGDMIAGIPLVMMLILIVGILVHVIKWLWELI